MQFLRKCFLLFLLGAALLVPQAGECFVTLRYKDVPAGHNTIRLPYETYIIEYEIGNEIKEPFSRVSYGVDGPVNFYQLVLDDGGAYRSAWLLCVTVEEKIPPAEKAYFDDLTQERKEELLKQQELARSYAQSMLAEYAPLDTDFSWIRKYNYNSYNYEDFKVEVLAFDWPDIQFLDIAGKQAMRTEARVAANLNGIFLSMYAQGYVFALDERANLISLVCFDSDRAFWQEIMDRAVTTVRQ